MPRYPAVGLSVALGAFFVRDLGPGSFFLFSAATLAAALLGGLSQRSWRDFGSDQRKASPGIVPPAAVTEGELL